MAAWIFCDVSMFQWDPMGKVGIPERSRKYAWHVFLKECVKCIEMSWRYWPAWFQLRGKLSITRTMHIDAPSCRVACRLRRLAGSDPIVACCYVEQRVGRAKEKNILFMTNSSSSSGQRSKRELIFLGWWWRVSSFHSLEWHVLLGLNSFKNHQGVQRLRKSFGDTLPLQMQWMFAPFEAEMLVSPRVEQF